MPALEEKRAIYEDVKRKNNIWSQIIEDPYLTKEEADIAFFLSTAGLDITNPKDLELLRVRNPETGDYEPLDIPLWAEMDKETALGCIHTVKEHLDKGVKIYNFNTLKESDCLSLRFMYFKADGTLKSNSEQVEIPKAPKEVHKPGSFKRLINRLFGAFKSEVKAYDEYLEKKKEYDERMAEVSRIQAVADEYSDVIRDGKEKNRIYNEENQEIIKNKPLEQSLREAAEKERSNYTFQEVVSGKSNVILGRNKNYHDLKETPLKVNKRLPMAGLALLSGCAVEANAGVKDNSSDLNLVFLGDTKPTEKEKELFKEMAYEQNFENISAKVMESCYSGQDIERMGPRTEAIVNGRKMLNEAVESYSLGDKAPLINIIKGSIDTIFSTVCTLNTGVKSPTSMAVSEIVDALDELFDNDSEIKEAVGFPEEKMQALRGAAKAYKEFQHWQQHRYEDYKKDGGPNSLSRKQIVEDRIFREALFKLIEQAETEEITRAKEFALAEIAKPENQEILNRYEHEFDKQQIINGMLTLYMSRSLKLPKLFFDMGDPEFDMEKYREAILEEARKTPEYQKYMEMEKDAFAREEMMDVVVKVAKASPAPLSGPTPTQFTKALEANARELDEKLDDPDFDLNEWRAKNTITIPN